MKKIILFVLMIVAAANLFAEVPEEVINAFEGLEEVYEKVKEDFKSKNIILENIEDFYVDEIDGFKAYFVRNMEIGERVSVLTEEDFIFRFFTNEIEILVDHYIEIQIIIIEDSDGEKVFQKTTYKEHGNIICEYYFDYRDNFYMWGPNND